MKSRYRVCTLTGHTLAAGIRLTRKIVLWATIVRQASTRPEAIGFLMASLAGAVVGRMLLWNFRLKVSKSNNGHAIMLATNILLWGLWWISGL